MKEVVEELKLLHLHIFMPAYIRLVLEMIGMDNIHTDTVYSIGEKTKQFPYILHSWN